mgnify:CR=1 FL=1
MTGISGRSFLKVIDTFRRSHLATFFIGSSVRRIALARQASRNLPAHVANSATPRHRYRRPRVGKFSGITKSSVKLPSGS